MYDSHVHSENSKDGHDSVQKIADYLPHTGIVSCAITDHCELVKETQFDVIEERFKKIESEINKVNRTEKYNLMFGIELGSAQTNTALAEKIINSFNFDVVLGSVHSVPDFDDVYKLREGTDVELIKRVLKSYFDEIKKLVIWNKFDVLTHLWYPVRYINSQEQMFFEFKTEIEEILSLLAQNNKALEVNTKASGKDLTQFILTCVQLFAKNGGKFITLGSDAHYVEDIGYDFNRMIKMLHNCGFKYYVYYKNREPITVQI